MSCENNRNCNTKPKEYDYTLPACIRHNVAKCSECAVLPRKVVETRSDMLKYRDTLVYVKENNCTYYLDEQGSPMFEWPDVVEKDKYDIDANPLNLRSQFCLSVVERDGKEEKVMGYYDKNGEFFELAAKEVI